MEYNLVVGKDEFSRKLAEQLNTKALSFHVIIYPEGEIKPTLELSSTKEVEGKKVLVVSRTDRFDPKPNDLITETELVVHTLKELGASRIDIFMPYMFYARQDKMFLLGEPVSLAAKAEQFESWGISNLFTFNSHLFSKEDVSLQDYFNRIKVHDISAAKIFSDYLQTMNLVDPFVLGPDEGSKKMVSELARYLNAEYGFLKKERDRVSGKIKIETPDFLNNLKGRDIVIYDDLTATGGTVSKVYEIIKDCEVKRVFVCLVHLLTENAIKKLKNISFDEIITTDSLAGKTDDFTELSLIPSISEYISSL